jgi:hypothetical protein
MSKKTLAADLNLSKQGVLDMIRRLVKGGLIGRDPEKREHLRTTNKWQAAVDPLRAEMKSKENRPRENFSHSAGKVSLPPIGMVSLPNNHIPIKKNIGGSLQEHDPFLEGKKIRLVNVRHPDERVLKTMVYFSDKSADRFKRPEMGNSEYFTVQEKISRLKPDDEKYLIDDWFDRGRNSPGFRTDLCTAFGRRNFNKWTADSGYTDLDDLPEEGTIPNLKMP